MTNDCTETQSIEDVRDRLLSGLPPTECAVDVLQYLNSEASPELIVDTDGKAIVLDLGAGSMALGEPLSGLSVERFSQLVERQLADAGTSCAFGRWGETRELYVSELFEVAGHSESRDVHLGVDLFCAAATPVRAPLDGRVHIKANNARELDYGPMLVLEHRTPASNPFFTLYGHLSATGIAHVNQGDAVLAGERIATIGTPPENGNWSPHLHFQLILDLLDCGADFPGVAYPSQREIWFALSPLPAMFFPGIDPRLLDAHDDARRAG